MCVCHERRRVTGLQIKPVCQTGHWTLSWWCNAGVVADLLKYWDKFGFISLTLRESFQMESILSMISMWRGSSLDMTATGHFSSASGMTVWLVKASVCQQQCCQPDGQLRGSP